MEGILVDVKYWVEIIAQILGMVVLFGTFIAKFFVPGKKDDALAMEAEKWWSKGVGYLPTIGINPRTKALEAAIKDVQLQKAPEKKEK